MKIAILIILLIAVVSVLGFIIFWKFIFPKFDMTPLTEEQLRACKKIVEEGKSYPFMCKWCIKNKKCACLPCKKMEKAVAELKAGN